MKFKFLWAVLYSFLFFTVEAQISITSVSPITSTTVGKYEKFELGVALNITNFNNQFDPNEIDVYAEFKYVASGRVQKVNGFWYQDFTRNESSPDPTGNDPCDNHVNGIADPNYLVAKPTPLPWRIRFAPNAVGAWTYQVFVKYNGQTIFSSIFDLNATTSNEKGYLGVGNYQTHFAYKNTDNPNIESGFVPLGVNILEKTSLVYNRAAFHFGKNIIQKMASANGNTVRVFMSPDAHGIEWSEDGLGRYLSRQNRAFDLDEVFRMAEESNLKIQLVFQSNHEFHNQADDAVDGYNYWLNNPYRALLGINNQYNYFTNAQCLELARRKLRYVIARWGYSNSLLAYELWNEVAIMVGAKPDIWSNNNGQAVNDWHTMMVNYGKSLDPNHMFTSSSGGPGFFNFGNQALDFTSDHYYASDMNVFYNHSVFAQYATKVYKKPYITGEFGNTSCWFGNTNFTHNNFTAGNYAHDMMEFHNTIWASLFNSSAGPSYAWDGKNLFNNCWGGPYKNFKPMSLFLQDDDFFTKRLRYMRSNPTGDKGPKDDPLHDYGNNSLPAWVYYPNPNNPPPPPPTLLQQYLTYDIKTSNDELLDVFAAQTLSTDGMIQGWVHHRKNYWYELPHHADGSAICATWNDNQPSTEANIPTLTRQTFTIRNVDCDGTYKVDFYSTYPQYDINNDNVNDDGGIIPGLSQSGLQANCGDLTVTIPNLTPLSYAGGSQFMPDYAFKITKTSDFWRHDVLTTIVNNYSKLAINASDKVFYNDNYGDIRTIYYNHATKAYEHAIVSNLSAQSTKVLGPICVNENSQVYYRGEDGRLQCYYLSGGVWNHVWLTNWANTSENVGGSIDYSPFNIFYQGADTKLHRYFFNSVTNSWVHSILPHNNDPNTYVGGAISVEKATNNIFYRGADGRLQGYYLSGGVWNHIWLTNWANTSENVGGDIKVGDGEIYYCGVDQRLHKYYFNNNSWTHALVVDQNNQTIYVPTFTDIALIGNGTQICFAGPMDQIQRLYNKVGNSYTRDEIICSNDVQSSYASNGRLISDNTGDTYYIGENDNNLQVYAFDRGCLPRSSVSKGAERKRTDSTFNNSTIAFAIDSFSTFEPSKRFQIFPNPFSNSLSIQVPPGLADEVRISDVTGRILFESKLDENEQQYSINTSKFGSGMYLVFILKEGKVINKAKIVKY